MVEIKYLNECFNNYMFDFKEGGEGLFLSFFRKISEIMFYMLNLKEKNFV